MVQGVGPPVPLHAKDLCVWSPPPRNAATIVAPGLAEDPDPSVPEGAYSGSLSVLRRP